MSIVRSSGNGRNRSEQLRDEAAQHRRRIEDERQWGNEDLGELRIRDYEAWARWCERVADAEAQRERGQR